MSNNDNSWFERKELPPVGVTCEFRVGNFWKKCEITGEAFDYGHRVVLAQIGDAAKCICHAEFFRPIKSEREKAIDEMVGICVDHYGNPKGAESYINLCAKIYDSGLLREIKQ